MGGWYMARAVIRRIRATDLRGKRVLITGGSRGLGLLLAREFASRGASLALCGRDPASLDRAKADLLSRGAEVATAVCDVTVKEQVAEMVQWLMTTVGPIDILINNAGHIQVGPALEMTLEDYEAAMRIHFWAPLYTTLAVLPSMRERRRGHIVNISSIGGKVSVPHLLPYCASKFALTGFSEGLHAELAQEGVKVTTVCPGLMRTGSPRNASFKGQHRAEYAWFSLGDSLPGISMSAKRAARKIVNATRFGEAERVLSIQAQLASRFAALFPSLTARLLRGVNRLLPGPGGIGHRVALGKDSETPLTRSWLTALGQHAAVKNNEFN